MSTLLEQAIIDAKELREAAVKSAEQSIIEKYAPEVKKAVESLLEQGPPGMGEPPMDPMAPPGPPGMPPGMGGPPMDPMMGGMPGAPPDPAAMGDVPVAPLAMADGQPLCPCPDEGQEVTIDFNELAARVNAEEQALEAQQAQGAGMGMGAPPPGMPGMPPAPPMLPPGLSPMAPGGRGGPPNPMMETKDYTIPDDMVLNLSAKKLQEAVNSEMTIPDELVEQLAEEIRINLSAPDSSLGGRTTPVAAMQEADEIVQAEVAVDEAQEEAEDVNENINRLYTEVNFYKHQSNQLRQALQKMQEHVANVNLSNARLLYTNRVLSDPSLNERQRNKIVDAISQCGSVEEAKVIYETLQNAVGSSIIKEKKKPESLREAVNRDRSLLLPRRQKSKSHDTKAYDRMKALAGLK